MREYAATYYNSLRKLFDSIRVTDKNRSASNVYTGIESAGYIILAGAESENKVMFIGNGASAAISSHMATDFLKNGGIRAIAFNDSSLLTCISNDYGYIHVFEKPIEMLANMGDVLIAISSSGKSENILRGVQSAINKGCKVITLSGFDSNNPLRSQGDLNFYVPSQQYGPVEIIHHSICHCILDAIINSKNSAGRLSKKEPY